MAKAIKKESLTRAVPYSLETEQAVLGTVLLDNSILDKVFPLLTEEDFYSAQHRLIYNAMSKLNEKNKPIDAISVLDTLDFGNKSEDAGGFDYISSLVDVVPSSANIENYVEILKRESLRRRIIAAGNEITNKAYELEDGAQSLDFATKLIYEMSQKETKTDLQQIGRAATEANNQIQKAQLGDIDSNVVYTKYEQFDEYTHGLKPGEVIILAARPAVGKSAFALNIATNVALETKKHVAVFSLEMGATDIARRVIAYLSRVSFDKMNTRGGMQNKDVSNLYKAFSRLTESTLFVDDDSMNTPSSILTKCRRLKKEHGLDLIIVDYLQLMSSENKKRDDSRANDVGDMSRKMKIYARDLGVPIILLSQMSRRIETENSSHEPQLADLRESGSIEQDADIVMFLSNPSKYDATLPKDEVILYIKKNRHGKTGEIKLHWESNITAFQEIADSSVTDESRSFSNETNNQSAMVEVVDDMPFKDEVMFDSLEPTDEDLPF